MIPTFRTSQPGSAADPTKPHLILVGLPGSGKTTVGQAVAEKTGRTFLDLDLEIERREGESISQIFGEKGEEYFRRRERELTAELRLVGNMIVSPGGGWMMNPDVVALVPGLDDGPAGTGRQRSGPRRHAADRPHPGTLG